MSNQAGKTVGGRYELLERIGSGGMAEVYLGIDQMLGRRVAVKILNGESASDPIYVERFRREAQAVGQINHPNIVDIYDWGSEANSYYMVMEYVEGENLKDRLRRGALPEDELLRIGAEAAAALEAAHNRGVIHRDIKPQNILLGVDGSIKVVDFGIAYQTGVTQLTRTNAVSGTAHYLSPEQARTRPVDNRSDLYSLGVVLYEMATGVEPFQGGSLVEIAMKHVHEQPVPPRKLRPDLSPATNALILRALSKHPDDRFRDAGEMRAALLAALPTTVRLPIFAQPTRSAPVAPAPRREEERPTSGRRALFAIPLVLALGAIIPVALHGSSSHSRVAGGRPHTVATQTPRARPGGHRIVAAVPAARPTVTSTTTPSPTSPPLVALPRGVTATPTTTATSPDAVSGQVNTVASSGGGDPAGTVASFYDAVNSHDFGAAAALWSPSMQANYPPESNINGRFGATQWIHLLSDQVASVQGDQATVNVDLMEKVYGQQPHELVGTWDLVKGSSGWLMNSPTFR